MTEVLSVLDFGIILLYLAGMLVIGAVVSRRIVSFRDYFVAGGRMTTALLWLRRERAILRIALDDFLDEPAGGAHP